MNKRQYKKFKKKLGCKTYLKYRHKRIIMAAHALTDGIVDPNVMNMVYIVDSKRMDLKHIHSVKLLRNYVPVAINTAGDNPTNIEIEFKSQGGNNNV